MPMPSSSRCGQRRWKNERERTQALTIKNDKSDGKCVCEKESNRDSNPCSCTSRASLVFHSISRSSRLALFSCRPNQVAKASGAAYSVHKEKPNSKFANTASGA